MQVALFGGSFNPPHVAHRLVAEWVLATQGVDELWLVPTFKHPFNKNESLEPYADRLALTDLLAKRLSDRVRVSRIEEELGGVSYTIDTINALQARFPGHSFRLIIGADVVPELSKWKNIERLRERAPFIVVNRAGFPRDPNSLSPEFPAISSSQLRGKIANGEPLTGELDPEILDYIERHGLFRRHAT